MNAHDLLELFSNSRLFMIMDGLFPKFFRTLWVARAEIGLANGST